MRFTNILAVVPWIAISGCAWDELLDAPTTLQTNPEQSSGQNTRQTKPWGEDWYPTTRDGRPAATTSTQVPSATTLGPAEAQVTLPMVTLADRSSGSLTTEFATSSTISTTNPDITVPNSTSPPAGSTGVDTSGNSWPPSTTVDVPSNPSGSFPTSPPFDQSSDPSRDPEPTVTTSSTDTVASSNDTELDAGVNSTARHDSSFDSDAGALETTEVSPESNEPTLGSTDTSNEPAQCETLLSEGFENITLLSQADWVLQNNSSPLGSTNWLQGDANIFAAQDGSVNSFIAGNYTNTSSVGTISNWLVTPEVPLENGSVLAFWTRDFGSQFADRLQVRMSTNGDSINVGTTASDVGDFTALLLDVNPTYASSGYPDTFTEYQVTVAGLAEPTTGRLAFRYFVEDGGPMGAHSDYVAIDSVTYPFCANTESTADADAGTSNTSSSGDTPTGSPSESVDESYQLLSIEGDGQSGLIGYALNVAPEVRVLNGSGVGVSGVSVSFAVASGGGSVTGDVQVTDAQGYARPAKWTLGATPGLNELTATVVDAPSPTTVSFTATGIASGFDIDLQYVTAINDEHEAVFEAAKERWQGLIIGDLPNVNLAMPANTCGTHPALSGPFDDLTIVVSVGTIDGVNGVLGQAGPCVVRAASGGAPVAGAGGLPLLGMMRFDVDDLDALASTGQLQSVILHEMGHVLGINSIYWRSNGYLQNPMPSSASNDTHFSGPKALAAFELVGGASYLGGSPVPVENCVGIPGCGSGTYNSHWREFALDSELMTGYVSPSGAPNPLSRVTVASLWDIGYAVNLDGADAYYNTFSNLLGLQTIPTRTKLEELPYDGPVFIADDNGITSVDAAHP